MATSQTDTKPTAPAPAAVAPTNEEVRQEVSSLPAQLNDVKAYFSLSKKSFVSSFTDPKEGEKQFAREVNFAAQALLANPYLIACAKSHPDDLVNAIKNVALTGSTLNPTLKLAYLVPFKGRITLMPSYMGLVDLLVNSGLAEKVEAHAVFSGDTFKMEHGTNGFIKHTPNPWGKKSAENLLGCYYYIKLTGGAELFDALSKEEIDTIKQRSPSVAKGQSSPWDTDYIEMAKKTALRRAFKACPKTGISESKLKAVEVAFDYEEKSEVEWVRNQPASKNDNFDEEEVTYEEVN